MKNNMAYLFFHIVSIFSKTECVKRFALDLSVTKYRKTPLISLGLTRFTRGFRWAYKRGEGLISGKGLTIRIKKMFYKQNKRVDCSKNVVTLRAF